MRTLLLLALLVFVADARRHQQRTEAPFPAINGSLPPYAQLAERYYEDAEALYKAAKKEKNAKKRQEDLRRAHYDEELGQLVEHQGSE